MKKKYVIQKKHGKKRYYIFSEHTPAKLRQVLGKGFIIKELNFTVWRDKEEKEKK